MTNQTQPGIVLLVLVQGLAGCGASHVPSAPSTPLTPLTPLIVPQPPGFIYGRGYTLSGVRLFGVVSEVRLTEQSPVAGVSVYCDPSRASSVLF